MAGESKVEMVEVPKAEFEDMKKMVSMQTEQIKALQDAAMTGAGADPKVAARAKLPYALVQFNEEYARMAVPSETQKGAMVYPGYTARAAEIVNLKVDEIERLEKDRPGLLTTDKKKFQDQIVHGFDQEVDKKTGRMKVVKKDTKIGVDTLIENAVEKG